MTNSDAIFCIGLAFAVSSPFWIYMIVAFFHFLIMKVRLSKKPYGRCDYVCTVRTKHTNLPIKNALVRVTREHPYIQGKEINVAWGKTDEKGLFVFWLDPGKYSVDIWGTHRNLSERMWMLGDFYSCLERYVIDVVEHREYLENGDQRKEKTA